MGDCSDKSHLGWGGGEREEINATEGGRAGPRRGPPASQGEGGEGTSHPCSVISGNFPMFVPHTVSLLKPSLNAIQLNSRIH